MKKKTVKLVSAVVVLGVLCAAYEGVNFYVTSQEEKETEENDTSVDLVSLEADDITAVSFTADQNEVEFDKKDDGKHYSIGYIAQDMEKIDPNFVIKRPADKKRKIKERYYINELPIIATLSKAIQEQQEQINKLQSKIEKLEARR